MTNFHGVTGGVYKTRERIHRSMLTWITNDSSFMQASFSQQSELGLSLLGFASPRGFASLCLNHCSTCVAQDVRGMLT